MKNSFFILLLIVGYSCKKPHKKNDDCFPNAPTYRQILNKPAIVRQQSNSLFYIVEHGTIDTRLNPCNLATDFKIDNLQVTISGEVKTTFQVGPGPCCTENFVITKITR